MKHLSQIPLSWKPFGVYELYRASRPWWESVGLVSVSRPVVPTLLWCYLAQSNLGIIHATSGYVF